MRTPIERRVSLSGKRKEVTHRDTDTSKKTSYRVDYPYGNRALMRCVCGKWAGRKCGPGNRQQVTSGVGRRESPIHPVTWPPPLLSWREASFQIWHGRTCRKREVNNRPDQNILRNGGKSVWRFWCGPPTTRYKPDNIIIQKCISGIISIFLLEAQTSAERHIIYVFRLDHLYKSINPSIPILLCQYPLNVLVSMEVLGTVWKNLKHKLQNSSLTSQIMIQ